MPNLKVGRWKFRYTDVPVRIKSSVCDSVLESVNQWTEAVAEPSKTFAAQEYGVRSLILRISGVEEDGRFLVYGIDDRPYGFGFLNNISKQGSSEIARIRKTWPEVSWIPKGVGQSSDDELWLGNPLDHSRLLSPRDDTRVILRGCFDESRHPTVVAKAVVPTGDFGSRLYGERMGLWSRVACRLGQNEGVQVSCLTSSVVIKPTSGADRSCLGFYLNPDDEEVYASKGGLGKVLASDDLCRFLRDEGSFYSQPFIPPMRTDYAPGMNVVHHYFAAFNCDTKCFEIVGGMWMGNPGLMVVGHRDSISGPLVFRYFF